MATDGNGKTERSDNWNPGQYEKFKKQRSKPFWDLVSMVDSAGLRSVVDLGCGTGELTFEFHRKLKRDHPSLETIGIDSSANMLEKAKPFEAEGLQFRLGDIASFAPESKFDLVISNAALQWLPDHRRLLPQVLKWVAPRGQIAVQVPCGFDHPSHVIAYQVSQDLFGSKVNPMGKVRSVLTIAEYAEILYVHGFKDCRSRMETYLHPMEKGEDVIEWTKGTLLTSFRSQMSDEDFQRFIAEYRKRLLAEIGEGFYLYPFNRILFWGRKDDASTTI